MGKRIRGLLLTFSIIMVIAFALINSVLASSYKIEFNQITNKLEVNEFRDNIKILNYSTQEGLSKVKDEYYFIKEIRFDRDYDSAEVSLILDQGVTIKEDNVYPKNYVLETDGSNIIVKWNFQNVRLGESVALFIIMEDSSASFSKIVRIVIIIVVLAILFLILSYLFISRKIKKKDNFDKHLMENEKKVILELKKADKNELWQKQLQLKTGFSKAKLSRIVRDLESRGLISKIPFGNTNKIIAK